MRTYANVPKDVQEPLKIFTQRVRDIANAFHQIIRKIERLQKNWDIDGWDENRRLLTEKQISWFGETMKDTASDIVEAKQLLDEVVEWYDKQQNTGRVPKWYEVITGHSRTTIINNPIDLMIDGIDVDFIKAKDDFDIACCNPGKTQGALDELSGVLDSIIKKRIAWIFEYFKMIQIDGIPIHRYELESLPKPKQRTKSDQYRIDEQWTE